jgi:hypothetical protein
MSPVDRWPYGQAEVEDLLRKGDLEQVPPNRPGATTLITKARVHLGTADREADLDPETAADALHAANRKALDAVLLAQGIRASRQGGHITPLVAVRAQLRTDPRRPRPDFFVYDVVRRIRHGGDYNNHELEVRAEDVRGNIEPSTALVDVCSAVIDHMPVFRPDV